MKAHEAKQLSDQFQLENSENGYNAIIKKIEEASKKGDYSIYVYTIHQLTKQKLEADGYRIAYNQGDFRDQRERSYYTISWN